ncbi:MAG: amino acid ABC transporter substrate-binding protein [Caldilineaceae bacterium]
MKRITAIGVLVLSLLLAGCGGSTPASGGGAAAPAAANAPGDTITIGYTASMTGKLNVESGRQANGLTLWIEDVNADGGIKLADGKTMKVAVKSYDDESNTDRIQELYTRLATEDGADFLISPYSSGLAAAASVIAEQYGKVMITTGAASDSNYEQGYSLVYQAYTPASKYMTGAIDFLKAKAPEVKKIAIVHENDKFSTDVSDALNEYATAQGYQIVMFEGYDSGTTDFAPFINKIQEAAPDAILGGGHFQDGSTFARQLAEKNVAVPYVALLVAPPEPRFAELGAAAQGVIGPSQWEPQAAYSEAGAKATGLRWFGPSVDAFLEAYQAKYGEEPSYHAAGGYAAGLILQDAIERAGTTDSAAVAKALNETDMMTFFGDIKFDTTAEKHGLQTGHEMVYVQWQKGEAGVPTKQIIWPEDAATKAAITR